MTVENTLTVTFVNKKTNLTWAYENVYRIDVYRNAVKVQIIEPDGTHNAYNVEKEEFTEFSARYQ